MISRTGFPVSICNTLRASVVLVAIAIWPAPAVTQVQQGPPPPEVGPERGSLVIVGGAMRSAEIYERFIELAGGPDAHIVLVPTAGGAAEYASRERAREIRALRHVTLARVEALSFS